MSSLEQQQKRPSLHFTDAGGTGTGAGAEAAAMSSSSSPATTPLGGTTGFLPDMPQWKKDLIQRRKTNVARTNNAAALISPTAADIGCCTVALTEPSGESYMPIPEVY